MERMRKQGLWSLIRFDRQPAEFELLETERGEPSFWGGWHEHPHTAAQPEDAEADRIAAEVLENRRRLSEELRGQINSDLILRTFLFAGKIPAMAAFLNGMADETLINDFILRPGMRVRKVDCAPDARAQFAMDRVFAMQEAECTESWQAMKEAVEEGRTAVFLEGERRAVLMDTRGYVSRSVDKPINETVILGPNEAFTEHIRTNVTLLRRIIKTDDFVCEFRKSGGQNNNRIAILYREGVANRTLVNEVKRRFAAVDTLMVLSIGMLEQMTERHSYSPLPQSLSTERPDRAAALLMQGHVCVLCEGCPQANVMPATLFTLMSSGADAYVRQPIGSFIRVVRYAGALLSILMPAYFLALAMHHQGLFSAEILSTVIASRNMVYLPMPIEMIFLLLMFQLLREASVGAAGALGQSVGIIGGLILGQAAVSANLVSKVALIIVALAGLGNFTVPDFSFQLAVAYYRIVLTLFAWMSGLLGLSCAVLVSVALLASIKSYGVPFLAPVAPKTYSKGPMIFRGRMQPHLRAEDLMNPERRRA